MELHHWEEEVVYQIYPRSFRDGNGDGIGDIPGIIEKLDYLKDLGVTMLWICPFYRSPMDDNGYDISDYEDIAPEFGTMADAERLIKEAAARGIRILLDLVINHCSDEHRWFRSALADQDSPYRDYFIFRKGTERPNNWRAMFGGSVWEKVPGREEYYYHTFSRRQPDLNWENPALRKALYAMIRRWMERGIAGFRVDAITFIKKDPAYASLPADGADGLANPNGPTRNHPGIGTFLTELKRECLEPCGCFTVAEAYGVPHSDLRRYIGPDGYFSTIFDFEAADLDLGERQNWFEPVAWTVKDLKKKLLDCQTETEKWGWAANFIENHDQPRAASKLLKEHENDPDAVKMLGILYFFLRGIPFIYEGQELGMVNFHRTSPEEFDDISSRNQYRRALEEGCTPAEALAFTNARSRDNARTPFPWDGSRFGGFTEGTPWIAMTEEYPRLNAADEASDPGSILTFYKSMIRFRQNGPYREVLLRGALSPLESPEDVIAYRRDSGTKTVLVYCSFSSEKRICPLPAGTDGRKLQQVFENSGTAECGADTVTLRPFQAVLLTEKPETGEKSKAAL